MDLLCVRNLLSLGKSLSDINLRVCIYARVSTDHLEQKKSLENQLEYFQDYIYSNSNWTYVDSYVDDGISGTSDVKRDNFMRMINDAQNGLFDLIITKEISRFSRNTLDSIKYTRLLLTYGVSVYFVSDNINTIFTDSELRLTIMASMAQDEVRRLSERVRFGMNRAIERGEILGNDMLYGYKKNKENGKLEIIECEANVIKEIFELYVYKKYSLGMISSYLNKTFFDKKWYSSTVSRVIENPKYKGYYCGKKSRVIDYITKKKEFFSKDEWIVYKNYEKIPPIVDERLWNLANKRLISRKKKEYNINSYKDRYLYSSKIFCGRDNCLFHRRIFRKNKAASWICSNYLKYGKLMCNSSIIREEELTKICIDLLNDMEIKYADIINYLKKIYCSYNSDSDKLYDLLKKKQNLYIKRDKLLDLNVNNLLLQDEFYLKNEFLQQEIKKINHDIDSIFERNPPFELRNLFNNNLINLFNETVISYILDRIIVLSNSFKCDIYLDIYLNCHFSSFGKIYTFKRGGDTISTKRYEVSYYVNFIFNNQSIK